MSHRTVTFSSGCGAWGPPVSKTPARFFLGCRPGTTVSSARLVFARPPQAMNAIFSLLFKLRPRRNAGAPATDPTAAKARPANVRRVIAELDGVVVGLFMEVLWGNNTSLA